MPESYSVTSAPGRRFRPRTTDDAASATWRIVASLGSEWVRLDAQPSTRVLLRQWARRHPVLQGYDSLADLLDGIDDADRDTSHAHLLALLHVHRGGSAVAGQAIVQAMLPKAVAVATGTRGPDAETKVADAVTALWETLARIDLARPPSNLPAHLGLEMLHALTAPTRARMTEVPSDDVEVLTRAVREHGGAERPALAHLDGLDVESDLDHVLAWATDNGLITPRDSDFLLASRGGGLDPAGRQRRSRLTRRLRRAVAAHLDGSHMLPVSRLRESDPALRPLLAALEAGVVSRGEALLVAYTSGDGSRSDASGVDAYARRHGLTAAQVRDRRAAVLAAVQAYGDRDS